jgi:mannose/cellobiose epimerase-like protein (N-acyl-D-glucosamine 2-epimerase family)
LYETAEELGINLQDRPGWVTSRLEAVSDGDVAQVKQELETPYNTQPHPRLKRLIGYITRFYDAMHYDEFQANGYPIGSGEIESAHEWIDRSINEVERDFMKEEFKAVLEAVGPNGEFWDTFEGRMICPGHSIECAWFILHEAKYRGVDQRLQNIGLRILNWSWKYGWDEEYGGMLYYRDAKGLPCTEYWHDMKFWWPHNETIIATLLAYHLTGDEKYAQWYQMIHNWAYKYFPDPEYGEWYGYLHRDGRLSTRLKGNNWKGPFHLPRMQLYCWKLLEEMTHNVALL